MKAELDDLTVGDILSLRPQQTLVVLSISAGQSGQRRKKRNWSIQWPPRATHLITAVA